MRMGMRHLVVMISAALMLSACDTWLGGDYTPPVPGERLSVLAHENTLKPSAGVEGAEVRLPRPFVNPDWPQAGGYAHHAMHHLSMAEVPQEVWTASIGAGSDERNKLLSQPIIANGAVFAIDSEAQVSAHDLQSGDEVWSVSLAPAEEDGEALAGGGVAYEDGRLFVATGYSQITALDARTGETIWQRNVTAPVRAAPTIRGGRVFAVSVDNRIHALSFYDGSVLWSRGGIVEVSSILGSASPAVDAGVVVTALSSGELIAMRVSNGGTVWTDALTTQSRTSAISDISDIPGRPVIYKGVVFAVGQGGLMVAIDMRTGMRLWEVSIGGTQQPWIAGKYLFVISGEAELTCVDAQTGQVLWVTPLPIWEDPEARENRLIWSGPVLASDRLIVAGSQGLAYAVSPYSGAILGSVEMPDGVSLSPVVADGTMIFLTDAGDLVAYR